MKKKTIALILCIVLAVAVLPFTIGAAAEEYREQAALKAAAAAETAAPQQQAVKTAPPKEKARCGVCNKLVDKDSLKPLNCGEHYVCEECLKSEKEPIIELVKLHSQRLVCGDYGCDGRGHYPKPYEYCPTGEHYACTKGDHKHICDTCGKEYDCITAGNIHARCPQCKKQWCRGDHSFCPGCHKYVCITGVDHSVCGENGCQLRNCVDHEHCPICGVAALPNISGHTEPCGHLSCVVSQNEEAHKACEGCKLYACSAEYAQRSHTECEYCHAMKCNGKAHDLCPSCGEPQCNGKNHGLCPTCGKPLCGDKHGLCEKCEEPLCNGKNHGECEHCHEALCVDEHGICPGCGKYQCNGADHHLCETCGKPVCNGKDHTKCEPPEAPPAEG